MQGRLGQTECTMVLSGGQCTSSIWPPWQCLMRRVWAWVFLVGDSNACWCMHARAGGPVMSALAPLALSCAHSVGSMHVRRAGLVFQHPFLLICGSLFDDAVLKCADLWLPGALAGMCGCDLMLCICSNAGSSVHTRLVLLASFCLVATRKMHGCKGHICPEL